MPTPTSIPEYSFKEILESHKISALKRFIRESNIKYSKLKKQDIIELMMTHANRFTHIKHASIMFPKKILTESQKKMGREIRKFQRQSKQQDKKYIDFTPKELPQKKINDIIKKVETVLDKHKSQFKASLNDIYSKGGYMSAEAAKKINDLDQLYENNKKKYLNMYLTEKNIHKQNMQSVLEQLKTKSKINIVSEISKNITNDIIKKLPKPVPKRARDDMDDEYAGKRPRKYIQPTPPKPVPKRARDDMDDEYAGKRARKYIQPKPDEQYKIPVSELKEIIRRARKQDKDYVDYEPPTIPKTKTNKTKTNKTKPKKKIKITNGNIKFEEFLKVVPKTRNDTKTHTARVAKIWFKSRDKQDVLHKKIFDRFDAMRGAMNSFKHRTLIDGKFIKNIVIPTDPEQLKRYDYVAGEIERLHNIIVKYQLPRYGSSEHRKMVENSGKIFNPIEDDSSDEEPEDKPAPNSHASEDEPDEQDEPHVAKKPKTISNSMKELIDNINESYKEAEPDEKRELNLTSDNIVSYTKNADNIILSVKDLIVDDGQPIDTIEITEGDDLYTVMLKDGDNDYEKFDMIVY